MQQRNKKIDVFEQIIEKIANTVHVPADCLKRILRDRGIRAADFSIDNLYGKNAFLKHCAQSRAPWTTGKSVKVYKELTKQYRIGSDFNYQQSRCYRANLDASIRKPGPLVFISPKCTQQIMNQATLAEQDTFDTEARLYQFLNWTVRINKISGNVFCFENKKTYHNRTCIKIPFIIINTELHDYDGNELYMLCCRNDKVSAKAQKWQLVKLLTEFEIRRFMPHGMLPRGARETSDNFLRYRTRTMMTKRQIAAHCMASTCYQQLKNIVTGHARKVHSKIELRLSLDTFYKAIQRALQSRDQKHNLISILSILSGKKFAENGEYCIDQVLPVKIGQNWIGVVYRNGKPSMLLYDGYDITNKAILCDPSFDVNKLEWFTNNVYKVLIDSSSQSTPQTQDEEEKSAVNSPMTYSSSPSLSFMPSPAAAAAPSAPMAHPDFGPIRLPEGVGMTTTQSTQQTVSYNNNNGNNGNTVRVTNFNANNMRYAPMEGTDTMTMASSASTSAVTPNPSLFGNYQFVTNHPQLPQFLQLPQLPQQTAIYPMSTTNTSTAMMDGFGVYTMTAPPTLLQLPALTTTTSTAQLQPFLISTLQPTTSAPVQLPTLPLLAASSLVPPISTPAQMPPFPMDLFTPQQLANIQAANLVFPQQVYSSAPPKQQ